MSLLLIPSTRGISRYELVFLSRNMPAVSNSGPFLYSLCQKWTNFFHHDIQNKDLWRKLELKLTLPLKYVAPLPCEM